MSYLQPDEYNQTKEFIKMKGVMENIGILLNQDVNTKPFKNRLNLSPQMREDVKINVWGCVGEYFG